ncbi:MAG: hypothetical protein M3328_06060, partial [Chloroflexota bacterium]|nr:hypothetical protein [Chloroflexota bacterium]
GMDRLLHPTPAGPDYNPSLLEEVITLGVPAAVGGAVYIALIWLMRIPETQMVANRIRSRLKR